MSSMITFAANNEMFRKRKRVYRACEPCKKRRKRCTHTFDTEGEENNDIDSIADTTSSPSQSRGSRQSTTPKNQIVGATSLIEDAETTTFIRAGSTPQSRTASPSRFIGLLRPEAVLREQELDPKEHECGYWMMPSLRGSKEAMQTSEPSEDETALEKYLSLVNVSLLPPKRHLDALLNLYFSYVHPCLPIVDQERPGRRNDGALLSPMLLQAICIIASRHEHARAHLVISDGSPPLEPRDFAKRLYKSINAALNAKLERDRIVLIQVHTLLSLYVEGTDGAEQASIHLNLAIHGSHTFGMQFGLSRPDGRAEYLQGLFWCLWSLDRLNSTIAGRPVYMHDRDHRIESPLANPELKHTAFGIWLQLASGLDHVITYYRPNTDPECTGWEEEFPGFEEMIGDSFDKLDPSILTGLELFYHATAMCSHKSRPITEPAPSTPSYVRQSLSTVRVIQILSKEQPEDLPPLPIVPWALSLAMANAYRQFRQSKLPTHRNRAKNDLQTCCELLQKMRSVWWTAGAMADLGRAALKQASKPRKPPHGPSRLMPGQLEAQADLSVASAGGTAGSGLAITGGDNSATNEAGLTTDPLSQTSTNIVASGPNIQTLHGTESDLSFPPGFDPHVSPDWLNFDAAFENFDAVLGNSGADLSMELLRPFNFEDFGAFGFPD